MRKTRSPKKSPRPRAPRIQVSRYEYAQLCVQMGVVESQLKRTRIDLDIQLRRIAQIQDELDTMKRAQAANTLPPDSVLIQLPKSTVES